VGNITIEGITNFVTLQPAEGVSADQIKHALLTRPGITSVKPISDFADTIEELFKLITGMLVIAEVVVVIMSFLIAFNSTSISVDERAREIATMFAYGLPVRTVTRMQMLENFIIGALGTALGVITGWFVLNALMSNAEVEMPEVLFILTINPQTVALAALLGVVVVAITPLVSVRRMRKMDLPSTLRVME
jgi:putative ABC transport system permease protein